MLNLPLELYIDGLPIEPDRISEGLIRAVVISLFTWRRAEANDKLPGNQRFGWWGDTAPPVPGDRIGSRLWLLSRSPLTDDVVLRAREYAAEALAWLVEDGVAATVEVRAERQGLDRLALGCLIVRGDQSDLNIRFSNVWDYLSNSQ